MNNELDLFNDCLHNIMENKNIKKHKYLSIWTIDGGYFLPSDYQKRRLELLGYIMKRFPDASIIYSENPLEDGLFGDWLQTDYGSWIIPKGIDISEFFDWLYLGGWIIYSVKEEVDHSVFKRTDIFKPDDLWNMMKLNNINCILSAFHDNDPWIIGIKL